MKVSLVKGEPSVEVPLIKCGDVELTPIQGRSLKDLALRPRLARLRQPSRCQELSDRYGSWALFIGQNESMKQDPIECFTIILERYGRPGDVDAEREKIDDLLTNMKLWQ